MTTKHPIPVDAGMYAGWQSVPIDPSNEPLVCLDDSGIAGYPIYRYRYGVDVVLQVRKSVLERLQRAQARLAPAYELVVLDGYRSLELQTRLYELFFEQLRTEFSDESDEKIHARTEEYVRRPSLSHAEPSPHLTGGAVDVGLRHNGEWVYAGSEHDELSAASALRYFEDNAHIKSSADERSRDVRRILYAAMSSAGFAAYEPEWWHFNAPETQMGAAELGLERATFGPVE